MHSFVAFSLYQSKDSNMDWTNKIWVNICLQVCNFSGRRKLWYKSIQIQFFLLIIKRALNESKGHCKNEVLVNTDRIKYADQFLLPKLDEILNGLWENQGFWRPTIVICGAAYTNFIQFYLFCWKVRKNTGNTVLSSRILSPRFRSVWLLKSKEFFEKLKWIWNYFFSS